MLVGEIRDRETGVIAIEAALTGHLVLSTLHTNDAPSTPLRLIEMGIEPFLVTSAARLRPRPAARPPAVRAVQGAVRADRGGAGAAQLGPDEAEPPTGMHRAVGCAQCGGHGVPRPHWPIHEVMLLSEEIDRLIVSRAGSDEIRRVALEQGMVPLRQDGLDKVARGTHNARGGLTCRRLMASAGSNRLNSVRPPQALAAMLGESTRGASACCRSRWTSTRIVLAFSTRTVRIGRRRDRDGHARRTSSRSCADRVRARPTRSAVPTPVPTVSPAPTPHRRAARPPARCRADRTSTSPRERPRAFASTVRCDRSRATTCSTARRSSSSCSP